MEDLSVFDFFEKVRNNKIGKLDQLAFIKEVTENLQPNKVKLLVSDLKEYRERGEGKMMDNWIDAFDTNTDLRSEMHRDACLNYIQKELKSVYDFRDLLSQTIESTINSLESDINQFTEDAEFLNPFPRIFKTEKGFRLFEYLKENIVKNRHADISFIFRKLYLDEYIHQGIKESEFRIWLNTTYEIDLDKLKLLDYCKTETKEILYRTALRLTSFD